MNDQAVSSQNKQEQLYAAVDLGSNSFHLVIVRVIAGSVQIIGKVWVLYRSNPDADPKLSNLARFAD